MRDIIGKLKRGIRKPPKIILDRLAGELRAESERFVAPLKRRFSISKLLRVTACNNVNELWNKLSDRPYFANCRPVDAVDYERKFPVDLQRILKAADRAFNHQVNLLGTGDIHLGNPIKWNVDFKVNKCWKNQFYRSIDYLNVGEPSDVKIPWEVSRLQWAIPLGQAYLLTGDEKYASKTREIITSWIESNPYAGSVNWTCTMEVALRIFVLTWFFYVFKSSNAWNDSKFRSGFLTNLNLHCHFTELHIERNDINGNHFTADAAGMVFAGLFWSVNPNDRVSKRWLNNGWKDLLAEIEIQVSEDGCDYEASIAYHRLVTELFLLPAAYKIANGDSIDDLYKQRLLAMSDFTEYYMPTGGLAPLIGDADDARVVPFGGQAIGDHHYLPELVRTCLNLQTASKNSVEAFWTNRSFTDLKISSRALESKAFDKGGYFVLRNKNNHVFIDCAPIGLANTGGHGHNDALSFEAVLNGHKIISDSGAFVYTSSYEERNLFRSTAYHNIPRLDSLEINRFVRDDYLWNLHNDTKAKLIHWDAQEDRTVFIGKHHGYKDRLSYDYYRWFSLDHGLSRLVIADWFNYLNPIDKDASKPVTVDYQLILAPEVIVEGYDSNTCRLRINDTVYTTFWSNLHDLEFNIVQARVSPSYGLLEFSQKLVWSLKTTAAYLDKNCFAVLIQPGYCAYSEFDEFQQKIVNQFKNYVRRT
ncbi:MAG: alginate lyase family protein [Candidatus Pacebacteria bacterium]|nr:alginate lyase family protein [Candidatus Paceibacterota bacterium]